MFGGRSYCRSGNVHGEDHSYEITKSFGACGGCGAVTSGKKETTVIAKILRLRHTQKLNNYRGSDMRGDRQLELSLQND